MGIDFIEEIYVLPRTLLVSHYSEHIQNPQWGIGSIVIAY